MCVFVCAHSIVSDSTPRVVAHQAPLSVEFSRQDYWSGFPCPPPRNLPDPPVYLASPALTDMFFATEPGSPAFKWNFCNQLIGSSSFLLDAISLNITVGTACLLFVRLISVQFGLSLMSDSLWPHGLEHTRLPCPLPTPGSYSNSCPSSR